MLKIAAGAVAGYLAARTLLVRDEPPSGLPGPLQGYAERAHRGLCRARALAMDAVAEGRVARDVAAQELHFEYLRHTGRGPHSPAAGPADTADGAASAH